jgi:hypothetical protein
MWRRWLRVLVGLGAVASVMAGAAKAWRLWSAVTPVEKATIKGDRKESIPQPSIDASADGVGLEKVGNETVSKWSGIAYWVVPLLAVTVFFGGLALHAWQRGLSANDKLPQADGGLLLFVAAPLGNNIRAAVDLKVNTTGYRNTSLVDLTLTFEGARPGLRWFIAASGQYRPSATTPLGAFCPGSTRAYRVSATTIGCADNPLNGSRSVEYNSTGHIGALNGRTINRISDSFDGYIDTDTTIIGGTLVGGDLQPGGNDLKARISIPVKMSSPSRIASDEFYAYAPIAIMDQGDFGIGAPEGSVAVARPQARLAATSTDTPVNYLDVTALSFAVHLGAKESQLSWASPPTERGDRLDWRTTGRGIQTVRFSLHDPVAANRMSRDSFSAGIYISIASGVLLLLLEKLIESWLRSRRP